MKYFLAAFLLALMVSAAACGGDDAEPTSSPTEHATLEPGLRADAIEALRSHLAVEGLDGEPGTLTTPVECASLPDDGVQGDYCVIEPSVYASALALILVGTVEDPSSEAWQVREVFEDGVWRVIETVRLGE